MEPFLYYYILAMVFLFGAVLGSFIDVVVCRMHTGASLSGRSRCFSCGHTLRWYELLPFISFLVQRGRCRTCGARIPFRLFLAELLTATLFLSVFLYSVGIPHLIVSLVLACVLMVIALYDMRHMVIPNELVLVMLAIGVAVVLVQSGTSELFETLWGALFAGIGAGTFYGFLWLISKGRWIGLGDAKLAVPLGFMVGTAGVVSMVILSFWIGAVLSIMYLVFQKILIRGKRLLPFTEVPLTIKSEVPFAPFMILAFLSVYLTGFDVLQFMATLF